MKLASILSLLLAGGLLFGSAFSSADRNAPPPPPTAPAAPKPPKAPKGSKTIHVRVDGLDDMIDAQIKAALDQVGSNKDVPPAIRDKITKRLEGIRKKIRARVGNGSDLDPEELGQLGEEIGSEMEDFGQEMDDWGEQFGKQMEKKFGKFDVHIGVGDDDADNDDNNDATSPPDADDDPDDIDDAVRDMGKLNLKPNQRAQIKQLRADSDAKVATAKKNLDVASEALQKQLDNPSASDADISRAIDNVAQQEATIRKARILAWVNARRVLDDGQRKKVEGAAKGKTK